MSTHNPNIDLLETLRLKIEENRASVRDYELYEDILDDYYEPEEIHAPLRQAGITDYADLVSTRNRQMNEERYEKVEGFLIGALLGLGLGLLLAGVLKSK